MSAVPVKIFTEDSLNNNEFEFLEEQSNVSSKKQWKIKGPYLFTGVINLNGRMYYEENIEQVAKEYIDNEIKGCKAWGELGHPKEDVIRINYDRICHRIISLKKLDQHIWLGESIVNTGSPCGNILASMLAAGGRPGVSLRGAGDMDQKTKLVTLKKLITVDIVSDPSNDNYGAYCDGIFESRNYLINAHGELMESAITTLDTTLSKLPSKNRADFIISALNKFTKSF